MWAAGYDGFGRAFLRSGEGARADQVVAAGRRRSFPSRVRSLASARDGPGVCRSTARGDGLGMGSSLSPLRRGGVAEVVAEVTEQLLDEERTAACIL